MITKSLGLAVCLTALAAAVVPAAAQNPRFSDNVIKIGVMNDRSGPFSDSSGEGSAVAARLAVEEFGGSIDGVPIEIIVGDHQNKPDLGIALARQWIDNEKLDAFADLAASNVGLAVLPIATERNKIVLNTGASGDFTGKSCTKMSTQWNFNSYATSNSIVQSVMAEPGHDTWFVIAQDYAFGKSQVADLRTVVEKRGGKIIGQVLHPLGASDYSSFLVQAESSGAKVIAIGSVGSDQTNILKQAQEFGLGKHGATVVHVASSNLPDMQALGVEAAAGILFVSTFEWSRTPATKAWTERFVAKFGKLPSQNQVAVYSQVRDYLQAVKETGTDDSNTVMAHMKQMPVHDVFAENGRLREDGQMIHDFYVIKAKQPGDVKVKGDLFDIVRTVPGNEAFLPLSESECPLVKK